MQKIQNKVIAITILAISLCACVQEPPKQTNTIIPKTKVIEKQQETPPSTTNNTEPMSQQEPQTKSEVNTQKQPEPKVEQETKTEIPQQKEPTPIKPENELTDADLAAHGGANTLFSAKAIPDEVFARMQGKSFKDDCTIPREDLSYLTLLYKTADGKTKVGEMVVAKSVAQEVVDIFYQLYEANDPIKKMVLVDDYDASDEASCADGNTAAFNFRPVAGGTQLSNHAKGIAIDINTFENPYCISSQNHVFPPEASKYTNRELNDPYMIHEGDLCWKLFTERGWDWGGSWSEPIDYQHFEKV